MEQERERVMARIQKMLALANDEGATTGERDNALRMVHSILAKYNMTMAEAEAAGRPGERRGRSENLRLRDQPWVRDCVGSVADMLFCQTLFWKQRGTGRCVFYFVGRQSNVETARLMADFVVRSIISEANRRWREQPDPGPWWTSFCKGATQAVALRCQELRREAEASGLYDKEKKANQDFTRDMLGHDPGKEGKRRDRRPGAGFDDGVAYGRTVSLHRQVGSTQQQQLNTKGE